MQWYSLLKGLRLGSSGGGQTPAPGAAGMSSPHPVRGVCVSGHMFVCARVQLYMCGFVCVDVWMCRCVDVWM